MGTSAAQPIDRPNSPSGVGSPKGIGGALGVAGPDMADFPEGGRLKTAAPIWEIEALHNLHG
jgi:hypothetical protein